MPTPEHLFCFTGTLTHVTQDAATDGDGDIVEHTTTSTVRCWLGRLGRAVRGEGEQTALANTQTADAQVWLPADTVVSGLDRIEVDGLTWEVIGPPVKAVNPRRGGAVSHIEANVRAVT